MRILLTGAKGFVGARIGAAAPVVAAPSLRGASRDDVKALMDRVRPDAVIHTAAISDIAACQRDPEASRRANVLLPEILAQEAGGAKLILFSSDQVYSGCAGDGPYAEADTAPANLYARQKLEMEQRVLDRCPGAVILRATWMYDMPLYAGDNRGNFLVNAIRAGVTRTPLALSRASYRSVTYVREAAEKTLEALALPGGIYNFGSENPLSMYETAQALAEALGMDLPLMDIPPRHNLWIRTDKLREQGIRFGSAIDGLKQCVADYQLRLLFAVKD